MMQRRALARIYAWAVPTKEAISHIVKLPQPIVELGAGTGYWARLIAKAGGTVHAYDKHTKASKNKYGMKPKYYAIKRGVPGSILKPGNKWRTLLLCWPDYNTSFAYDAARLFQGTHLVYIGEGDGGCTGDDKFHDYLEANYKLLRTVTIPQWPGIRDKIFILERNKKHEKVPATNSKTKKPTFNQQRLHAKRGKTMGQICGRLGTSVRKEK